jgi:hypothetical protein
MPCMVRVAALESGHLRVSPMCPVKSVTHVPGCTAVPIARLAAPGTGKRRHSEGRWPQAIMLADSVRLAPR